MNLPSLYPYGNRGVNAHVVHLTDALSLWFSYATVVAFTSPDGLVVSENRWGPTTGRHLNTISTTVPRTPRAEFEAKLREVLPR